MSLRVRMFFYLEDSFRKKNRQDGPIQHVNTHRQKPKASVNADKVKNLTSESIYATKNNELTKNHPSKKTLAAPTTTNMKVKPKKQLQQKKKKRSSSATPDKSAKKKSSVAPGREFLKKFEKIDEKLKQYRQSQKSKEGRETQLTTLRVGSQTHRSSLKSKNGRLSLNKHGVGLSQRQVYRVNSSEKQRAVTYRSTHSHNSKPKKRSRSRITKQKTHQQRTLQSQRPSADKPPRKRFITQIKTQYSDEKKSYFDDRLYAELVKLQPDRQYIDDARQKAAKTIQEAWRRFVRRKRAAQRFKNAQSLQYSFTPAISKRLPLQISSIVSDDVPALPSYRSIKPSPFPTEEQDSPTPIAAITPNNHQNTSHTFHSAESNRSSRLKSRDIQKFRQKQLEKWGRVQMMIQELKANVGNPDCHKLLTELVEVCNENRRDIETSVIESSRRTDKDNGSLNKSNISQQFQEKRKVYDDAPLQHKLQRRKLSSDDKNFDSQNLSRELSSKKLLDEISNAVYNQQRTAQLQKQLQSPIIETKPQNSSIKKFNTSEYVNSANKQVQVRKLDFNNDEQPPEQVQLFQTLPSPPTSPKNQLSFEQHLQTIQIQSAFFDKNPKYVQLVEDVLDTMALQLAREIFEVSQLLHGLLSYRDNQSIQIVQEESAAILPDLEKQPAIQCSNNYVAALLRIFMLSIKQNDLEQFQGRISVPFGDSLLKVLRFFRIEDEDDIEGNKYQAIIDVEKFIQFEPTLRDRLSIQSTVSQYFFNHCIFDCLNECLDHFRPFGLRGRPPLLLQDGFKAQPFDNIMNGVSDMVERMLRLEVGKLCHDTNDMQQVNRRMQYTERLLDQLNVQQADFQWKQNIDLQFEVVLDLSVAITDRIIMEQVKILFRYL